MVLGFLDLAAGDVPCRRARGFALRLGPRLRAGEGDKKIYPNFHYERRVRAGSRYPDFYTVCSDGT
jgi:hypothetical protein